MFFGDCVSTVSLGENPESDHLCIDYESYTDVAAARSWLERVSPSHRGRSPKRGCRLWHSLLSLFSVWLWNMKAGSTSLSSWMNLSLVKPNVISKPKSYSRSWQLSPRKPPKATANRQARPPPWAGLGGQFDTASGSPCSNLCLSSDQSGSKSYLEILKNRPCTLTCLSRALSLPHPWKCSLVQCNRVTWNGTSGGLLCMKLDFKTCPSFSLTTKHWNLNLFLFYFRHISYVFWRLFISPHSIFLFLRLSQVSWKAE